MRRFVVIGQRATASPGFSIDDLPGTSGRLDVLCRCLRASLLYSHGLRRDTVTYLVLRGGERAPRSLRLDGSQASFVRPDERALGTLVKKSLAAFESLPEGEAEPGLFYPVRAGVAVAQGGLEAVLDDLGPSTLYVLEEGGEDVREAPIDASSPAVFVGDHLGFLPEDRQKLASLGALPLSVGPVAVHADDAVALAVNELDRRSPP